MNFAIGLARPINQGGTFAELGWPGGGGRVPRGSYVHTLTKRTTHINEDNNYLYSQLGELMVDISEEIVSRVDSKFAEVRRTNGSSKKNLRFDYDVMGNRIAKHIYADNASTQWENSTYYEHGANGNVVATYVWEATRLIS